MGGIQAKAAYEGDRMPDAEVSAVRHDLGRAVYVYPHCETLEPICMATGLASFANKSSVLHREFIAVSYRTVTVVGLTDQRQSFDALPTIWRTEHGATPRV